MNDLAVYVKVALHFALDNTSDSYLSFQKALLLSLLYFFFYLSPSWYFCTVFDTNSSNIDEVFSSINQYAYVFLFRDLNVNHKDWRSYSAVTDRLVNSVVVALS